MVFEEECHYRYELFKAANVSHQLFSHPINHWSFRILSVVVSSLSLAHYWSTYGTNIFSLEFSSIHLNYRSLKNCWLIIVFMPPKYTQKCEWKVLILNSELNEHVHLYTYVSRHVNKLNYERFINYNLIKSAHEIHYVLSCASFQITYQWNHKYINITNKQITFNSNSIN